MDDETVFIMIARSIHHIQWIKCWHLLACSSISMHLSCSGRGGDAKMTLFTGSQRVADKLAVDLKGKVWWKRLKWHHQMWYATLLGAHLERLYSNCDVQFLRKHEEKMRKFAHTCHCVDGCGCCSGEVGRCWFWLEDFGACASASPGMPFGEAFGGYISNKVG